MSDFLTRLELELRDAAARQAQPLWRRWTGIGSQRFGPDLEPRSRRGGPLAIGAAAVLLVLAPLGLAGGALLDDDDPLGAHGPTAAGGGATGQAPTAPPPGTELRTLAFGRTDKGDWRLTAHRCAAGGLALSLDARGTVICQDPDKPITVETRYEQRLDETFVFGLVGRQIDKVRVELEGKPVEVRARDAGEPLPDDTRFYVARVPGRRGANAKAAGLSKRGDEVACVPACGGSKEPKKPPRSGGRPGTSSSPGKSPSASGGGSGERRRTTTPERIRVKPVSEKASFEIPGRSIPMDFEINLYACGDLEPHHIRFEFSRPGEKTLGDTCRWQLQSERVPPITAASVFVPWAQSTFVYGVIVDRRIDTVAIRTDKNTTDVRAYTLDAKTAKAAGLPPGVKLYWHSFIHRARVLNVNDADHPGRVGQCTRAEADATYVRLDCASP